MDPGRAVEPFKFGDQTTSDVRICLKGADEQQQWFSCHSFVLSKKSRFFADWLARHDVQSNNCIEVQCPRAECNHYIKLLELLYIAGESLVDSFDSVKLALGVLRASISLQCDCVTRGCVEYLEAVPWDDNEEEEILEVAERLGPEAAPLIARLRAPSADAVKNVFISAIRFATTVESPFPPLLDELKTSAQEQVEYMLVEDGDTHLVAMDEDVRFHLRAGLTKMLSTLETELGLLPSEFDQSPELVEQMVLRSLVDLEWIANVFTRIEMMNDFVSDWTRISDHVLAVVQDEKFHSGLWAVKAKLIEVSGKAFDAVGYGSVVLPATCRVRFLKLWLPYIRKMKPLLDSKSEEDEAFPHKMDADLCQNIESAIVSMVLALPSSDQADILEEWMNRTEQFRYPDLTEAFEVWCYRAKTAKRRLLAGINGAGNPAVSL